MNDEQTLSWLDLKDEFAWDGSFRDICVPNACLSDWQLVLDAFRAQRLSVEYKVAGLPSALPAHAGEIFRRRSEGCLLSVLIDGVRFNAHFFDEQEVEFDLDPSEVCGQRELDAVLQFMKTLAGATSKDALLTPENMHDAPIVRISASGLAEYTSTGGFFVGASS